MYFLLGEISSSPWVQQARSPGEEHMATGHRCLRMGRANIRGKFQTCKGYSQQTIQKKKFLMGPRAPGP